MGVTRFTQLSDLEARMTLKLKPDEERWLEEYRQELRRQYPGVIEDLVVFDCQDSKIPSAKGVLNVAVVIKGSSDRDQSLIDLSSLSDRLAKSEEVNPIIRVYTAAEWQRRRQHNSLPFQGDGNSVWERDVIADIPGEEWRLPPWARPDSWKLRLNPDEKQWLADYRQALREQYPEVVKDLAVFAGHEGRWHTRRDAVNVVVTIKSTANRRQLAKDLSHLGYQLAGLSDAMPFIGVYTVAEWRQLQRDDTLPYTGKGISVWPPQS